MPPTSALSIEESNSIDDLIDPMVAELDARDILSVDPDQDFEEEVFLSLGHILAWKAAPGFGQGQDAALAALNQRAEMDLKEMFNRSIRYIHQREMRSDYPIIRRTAITNTST